MDLITAPFTGMDLGLSLTTVMVRQLPSHYTQLDLFDQLIERGFKGTFDFLYLPYDKKKAVHKGYGFVNFIHPMYAIMFRMAFHGCFLSPYMRMKNRATFVELAEIQGYEANLQHLAKALKADTHPAFRPLFFRRLGDTPMTSAETTPRLHSEPMSLNFDKCSDDLCSESFVEEVPSMKFWL
ncbi:unnamed protein product [Durusdinium trenchii]|uniref:Uncharacterized protein n=2 Tax=Durusdinium trenchii TaxID=1381693 RepID=A0ABP0RC77_9DINO|eukprot:g31192.t1